MKKDSMKKLWPKIRSALIRIKCALFWRCPKCGSYSNDAGYGEYCEDEKCGWVK